MKIDYNNINNLNSGGYTWKELSLKEWEQYKKDIIKAYKNHKPLEYVHITTPERWHDWKYPDEKTVKFLKENPNYEIDFFKPNFRIREKKDSNFYLYKRENK